MRSHALAAALVLASSLAFGQTQDYPNKPVRLTLGLPAGGTTDLAARLLAEKLRGVLGQPFVVENRPGANNLVATQAAAAAPNDGYHILYSGAAVTTGPALAKAWNIDAVKDLTPITLLVKGQVAIGTPPGAPYNTIDELVAHMKANPGKLNFANISAPDLVWMEMFRTATGVRYETVRYNGQTPAQNAIIAGQADFYTTPVGNAARALIDGGRIKLLAVMSGERSPLMPELPSFAESSVREVREVATFSGLGVFWFAMFGPPKLPRSIVNTLYQATAKIAKDPDYRQKLHDLGVTVVASTPEQLTQTVVTERARFILEARRAGLQPQ